MVTIIDIVRHFAQERPDLKDAAIPVGSTGLMNTLMIQPKYSYDQLDGTQWHYTPWGSPSCTGQTGLRGQILLAPLSLPKAEIRIEPLTCVLFLRCTEESKS